MKLFLTAFKMFLFMTLLTGVVYPALITITGMLFFNQKANGDFLSKDSKIVGAKLIGQKFESDRYFHSRPSAIDYNPLSSGGSNLGPTSQNLRNQVKIRLSHLEKERSNKAIPIPTEMLFASGSGLDPNISHDNAYFQVDRIVKARNLDPEEGRKKIKELIDGSNRHFFISHFSRPYLNVLMLNLSLDDLLDDKK